LHGERVSKEGDGAPEVSVQGWKGELGGLL
jgi:hypothetical protein